MLRGSRISMKKEKEIWVDSYYFPERYEVSNLGRIRNKRTQKIKKPCLDRGGYYKTRLWNITNSYQTSVHRLIYLSFNPDTPVNLHIHHLNHNKIDNRLSNLGPIDRRVHASIHAQIRIAKGMFTNLPHPGFGINNASCKGIVIAICPKTFEIKHKMAGFSQIKNLGFTPCSVYRAVKIPTKKYKGFLFRRLSINLEVEIGDIYDSSKKT